ncbi:Mediator of RNA polymerase II transcription subunit 8 [Dendrobium catenatum]|uniref:Mediator of RNA polymerase II transcription subunit 8 n=1 Tax=Dendrobium catenatum TaxID=906689 RepID=A0A2I0VJL4_9ASPA|nr:Mediator of RNA polymerase II transcription subunit 8 [Dendrobium catenatum]
MEAVGGATAAPEQQQPAPTPSKAERLNLAVQQQLNLESVKARALGLSKAISRILEDFNAIALTNATPKWQDILGQFSMVNMELFNIVEDIKKVSKAFVVHPKNVNAENALILPVMLSSKLLPEMEVEDNAKREQLLSGMANLPIPTQMEKLKVRIDMISAACETAEKVIADTRKAHGLGSRQGPTLVPTLDKVQAAKIQEQENQLRAAVNFGEGLRVTGDQRHLPSSLPPHLVDVLASGDGAHNFGETGIDFHSYATCNICLSPLRLPDLWTATCNVGEHLLTASIKYWELWTTAYGLQGYKTARHLAGTQGQPAGITGAREENVGKSLGGDGWAGTGVFSKSTPSFSSNSINPQGGLMQTTGGQMIGRSVPSPSGVSSSFDNASTPPPPYANSPRSGGNIMNTPSPQQQTQQQQQQQQQRQKMMQMPQHQQQLLAQQQLRQPSSTAILAQPLVASKLLVVGYGCSIRLIAGRRSLNGATPGVETIQFSNKWFLAVWIGGCGDVISHWFLGHAASGDPHGCWILLCGTMTQLHDLQGQGQQKFQPVPGQHQMQYSQPLSQQFQNRQLQSAHIQHNIAQSQITQGGQLRNQLSQFTGSANSALFNAAQTSPNSQMFGLSGGHPQRNLQSQILNDQMFGMGGSNTASMVGMQPQQHGAQGGFGFNNASNPVNANVSYDGNNVDILNILDNCVTPSLLLAPSINKGVDIVDFGGETDKVVELGPSVDYANLAAPLVDAVQLDSVLPLASPFSVEAVADIGVSIEFVRTGSIECAYVNVLVPLISPEALKAHLAINLEGAYMVHNDWLDGSTSSACVGDREDLDGLKEEDHKLYNLRVSRIVEKAFGLGGGKRHRRKHKKK